MVGPGPTESILVRYTTWLYPDSDYFDAQAQTYRARVLRLIGSGAGAAVFPAHILSES